MQGTRSGYLAIIIATLITTLPKVNAQLAYEGGRMGTFYKVYIYKKQSLGGGKYRFQTKTVFHCGTRASRLPDCKPGQPYVSEWRIADCLNVTINGNTVPAIARSGHEQGEPEIFKSVCQL